MNSTPLRYPGGKTVMSSFFAQIIEKHSMTDVTYVEPYAGGAGAAINLLVQNKVSSLIINDACVGVYSFWHYLVTAGNKFLQLFDNTDVTLDEWQHQRTIFKTATKPSLKLGFATFFMSRCNRSGILHAGPIGGQDPVKQSHAKYKLDCRFTKSSLRKRLCKIIELSSRITAYNLDALDFLKQKIQGNQERNFLVYLDPPYHSRGSNLYMDKYKPENHQELATYLRNKSDFNWVLSYDNVEEVRELYSSFRQYNFDLIYTAQRIKSGSELLVHSKGISLPPRMEIKRSHAKNIPIIPQ